MAKRKGQTETDANYWNPLTLLMPSTFSLAAREAAHRYQMPVPEYCRQALLLRLAADGVRLEDFADGCRSVVLTNEQSSNKGFEMAMGTDNTALTRASRKLKELASDTISIPTTAELCDRKSAELADARQALDAIIQRQRELEKDKNRPGSATDSVRAEKEKQLASVARLENESATLEAARQAEKPAPALTPRQQVRADFFNGLAFDPYAKARRGSPEKIAAAQQAVDELVREYRLTQPSGNARETMTAKLNAARLRLTALEGPPYPPYMPWASRETLAAARKAEGLE